MINKCSVCCKPFETQYYAYTCSGSCRQKLPKGRDAEIEAAREKFLNPKRQCPMCDKLRDANSFASLSLVEDDNGEAKEFTVKCCAVCEESWNRYDRSEEFRDLRFVTTKKPQRGRYRT